MANIHPSAIIEDGALIGDGCIIGPLCVVGPQVVLDAGVELKSHVVVTGRTRIGEGTVVFSFAVIGEIPQDLKFKGEASRLEIGARNRIREHVTMNAGTDGGGGVTLDAIYPVGQRPIAVDLGDIDGDGDLDLVASNFGDGTWTILENDGAGRLGNPRILNAMSAGSCAVLVDIDGDGDLDMVGIDEIDDLVFVFRNQ